MGKRNVKLDFDIWWPERPESWGVLRRYLMPYPGTLIMTLLLVGGLLWAGSVGAIPLRAPAAATTSTGTIAYQGRLADSAGNPITDTVNMIFRLYDVPTGGAPLWEEQWTGSNGVQVSDGLFNVMLGSLTQIPQNVITEHDTLWLGITVGTDDEMEPRVQMGTVPFAVQALTVPDGSVTTEKIADGAVTSPKMKPDLATAGFNNVTTTATEWEDIPNASVSMTASGPAQFLCMARMDIRASGSTGDIQVGLFKGADLVRVTMHNYDVAGHFTPLTVLGVINTSNPGTYTFKLRWRAWRGGGGEINLWNGVLVCMQFGSQTS